MFPLELEVEFGLPASPPSVGEVVSATGRSWIGPEIAGSCVPCLISSGSTSAKLASSFFSSLSASSSSSSSILSVDNTLTTPVVSELLMGVTSCSPSIAASVASSPRSSPALSVWTSEGTPSESLEIVRLSGSIKVELTSNIGSGGGKDAAGSSGKAGSKDKVSPTSGEAGSGILIGSTSSACCPSFSPSRSS